MMSAPHFIISVRRPTREKSLSASDPQSHTTNQLHGIVPRLPISTAAFIPLLFISLRVFAQGDITVTTDKEVYAYGEEIRIEVTIVNNSTETFQLSGSSTCQAYYRLDDFDAKDHTGCLLDYILITFRPGSWRSWSWTLSPKYSGLPKSDGSHMIVGYYPNTTMADTTYIEAPQYIGGLLGVGFEPSVDDSDIASIRDSLSAEVLYSYRYSFGLSEIWNISGYTLEEAVAMYSNDSRFRYVEANRESGWPMITNIENTTPGADAQTASIYPNPCRTRCDIAIVSGAPEVVDIVVSDIQGRRVTSLSSVFLEAGLNSVALSAHDLSPGVYLFRIHSRNEVFTGKFVVTR